MPRDKIDLGQTLEYLSILNEDGELDEELEPDVEPDLLERMYRHMVLARRFDEKMLELQRSGRMGTFAPVKGQEAAQIGSAAVLEESDWMVQSYRDHAAGLWRGERMEGYLVAYAGFYQGAEGIEEVRDLPVSVPVGSQLPHAAGMSYGAKLAGKGEVVLVYFGDGATSEGDFHEAVNFAGVFQTPVVFLCQNNQYAISVPLDKQTHSETLAQKALAYDIHGIQVDGNDILAVYAATKKAVGRAREGEGPTLIECKTYRLSMHTTADDPTRYRTDEEVEDWEKRDPIPRFRQYLIDRDTLSEEKAESIEEEVETAIADAISSAEERMEELRPDALSMFEHHYEEMPQYLKEQRDELSAYLNGGSNRGEKQEEAKDGSRKESAQEEEEKEAQEA